MPIPFILGGLAILAGAAGVAKGIEAKETMEYAQEDNEEAQKIVEKAKDKVEKQKESTRDCIEELGKEKLDVMAGSMQSFVETYSKLKNVVLKDSVGMEELSNFTPESVEFKKLKNASFEASDLLAGAGGGIAGGTLLAAGTYGAVMGGGFAAASTGAGIAGLSGVAATNATLAWLGGGSLAAGGFGMAGGMAVLGGLVAGPLLAVGGFFMSAKASEAWSQAQENLEKAETFEEECKNVCSMLKAMGTRANQIEKIIDRLDTYFQSAVTDLQKVVAESGTDFRKYSKTEVIKVYKSVQYASAMKAVLDTSLLTEKGKLTDESAKCVETADEKLDALRRKEISVATTAAPKKATNAVEKENNISASQDEPKTRKDCYEKGWELERHGDIAGAKRYYKMAADKGHIVAKNRLKFLRNK